MCSSPSSSPTQTNLLFTSINTEVSQLRTKAGQFAVGSIQKRSTKTISKVKNDPSQVAITVNVLSQLSEDEASILANKINLFAALHMK